MLPGENSREVYARYLRERDERMRAAAAEGYARLKHPADLPLIEEAYQAESKTAPRLSLAFALVSLGKRELTEFSPLRYLINNLNSNSWRGVSFAFLVELARDPAVRASLYQPLAAGTKDEKIGLLGVLGRSGDRDSLPHLEKLQNDSDLEVAQEAVRAVRSLRARS
jgi:HEAT repeat protein